MLLDIYGQFMVRVVAPIGGWSKGRPIAFIEDHDRGYPADLLIPNGLTSSELERYVTDKYSIFAQPGRKIRRLDAIERAA